MLIQIRQLYHSIHARGENVEEVLREAEREASEVVESSNIAAFDRPDQAMDQDFEDGELPPEEEHYQASEATAAFKLQHLQVGADLAYFSIRV